jgi:hypothetical protein
MKGKRTKKTLRKKRTKNKTIYKDNEGKEFKQVKCSPSSDLEKINKAEDFTCYNDETLLKIREIWNSRHPDAKIESSGTFEIWTNIKEKMKDSCNNESCWIKQMVNDNKMNKEILTHTFAPSSPQTWKKNPNEWLSSVDIVKVMKQYENAYSCFEFIGPSPIDFDTRMLYNECVWTELCNFEIAKYIKKGKNKIGIIFNTDPHYKDGSHWISLFINIRKRFILYFDSNGDKTPKEITLLCTRILNQCKKIGINDMKFYENKLEHQKSNTECGMYSLFLIIQLIKDVREYDYYMKNRIKDEDVERLRKEYFNEETI